MIVKIIKCNNKMGWYYNQIGKTFVVEPKVVKSMQDKDAYLHMMENGIGFINVEDCIDVRELKLERILNES